MEVRPFVWWNKQSVSFLFSCLSFSHFLCLHAYWLTVSFLCCSVNLFSPSCGWIAWGEKPCVCVNKSVYMSLSADLYILWANVCIFQLRSCTVCGCEGWILCCGSIGNAAVVVNMHCMDDRNPPLELLPFSQASKATLKQTGQQTPKGF